MMAAVVLAVTGCGGSDGGVETVPVEGQVTWEGQPVTNGSVIFVPDGGGPPAEGTLDAEGHYQLTTGSQPGAVPGLHKVMISSSTERDPAALPEDEPVEETSPLPEKYGISGESSGLTATVSATETNTIDFHLTETE